MTRISVSVRFLALLIGAASVVGVGMLGLHAVSRGHNAAAHHASLGHYSISGRLSLQGVFATGTFATIEPSLQINDPGSGSTTAATLTPGGAFIEQGFDAGSYRVTASANGFVSAVLDLVQINERSMVLPDRELPAGDADGDGAVTIRDLSAMSASFGQPVADRTDGEGRFVDSNGDGQVNVIDLTAAASSFGIAGPVTWGGGSPAPRLATKPPIGTNVGVNRYWIAQTPFVDVFKSASRWISYPVADPLTWDSDQAVPVGPQGYPTQVPFTGDDAQQHAVRALLYTDNQWEWPTGDYTLIYEGDGDITLDWDVGGQSINAPGTYTINIPSTNPFGIQMTITRSNPLDPVRGIHMILPGFLSIYQTDPIHPDFVDALDEFAVLRFTDWAPVNVFDDVVGNRATTTWAGRVTTNDATQSTEQGVAWEYIVEVSNLAEADAWVSIPHRADDEYITQIATLLRDGLDSERRVYIEYSNEVWNLFDYPFSVQYEWASAMGQALGLSADPRVAGQRYTAQRSAQIFELFESVWGPQAHRLVNVLAGFVAQPEVTREVLSAFHQTQINGVDINPNGVSVDAFAIAPYFGGEIADDAFLAGQATSTTVDDIFDALELAVDAEGRVFVENSFAEIEPYGVPMITYEGGQSLWARTPDSNDVAALTDALIAANRDQRMYGIYDTYFDHWFASGGTLFMHYKSVGLYDRFQTFGSIEAQDQPLAEAPKHRYLLDLIAALENGTRPLQAVP